MNKRKYQRAIVKTFRALDLPLVIACPSYFHSNQAAPSSSAASISPSQEASNRADTFPTLTLAGSVNDSKTISNMPPSSDLYASMIKLIYLASEAMLTSFLWMKC